MIEDLSPLYFNPFASIQNDVRKDNQLVITYDLKEYLYNSIIYMLYLEYYIYIYKIMLHLEYYIFQVLFHLYLYVCLYARGYVNACVQVLMEAKKGVRSPEAGVNQTHNTGRETNKFNC